MVRSITDYMPVNGYSEYDSVRVKLRVSDTDNSMRDEIQLYMNEIDDLVNNRLRAKLGTDNIYGEPIVLPLTSTTIPTVPIELKGIANDLVVAKIRLQNAEKPLLWDSAVKVLDNFLEKVYGWTREAPFQPIRTFSITPTSGVFSTVVTVSGTNFEPTAKIRIVFSLSEEITTPDPIISTSTGTFTGTFVVPVDTSDGAYTVKANDTLGGLSRKFQVTS